MTFSLDAIINYISHINQLEIVTGNLLTLNFTTATTAAAAVATSVIDDLITNVSCLSVKPSQADLFWEFLCM